ncbi:hypothetical protein [Methanimicrococcus stummii]|nr:hypothetical protein [Methanimicrococcus sp. Es2]
MVAAAAVFVKRQQQWSALNGSSLSMTDEFKTQNRQIKSIGGFEK